MISTVRPLPVGNALQIFLEPPSGSKVWRLLRKGSDTFIGEVDAGAITVFEGTVKVIIDTESLQNGIPAYYRAYYYDGAAWTASNTAIGTANSTYQDDSTDVLSILRDRMEVGIRDLIDRGLVQTGSENIQVLTAPPQFDDVRFPVITVHLANDDTDIRGIGELLEEDDFDVIGDEWEESEGWLAQVQVELIAWCLNPDERIAIRKAMRSILAANLPIFAAAGMVTPDIKSQDIDAINGEYASNIFQAVFSFNCHAPVRVTDRVDPIRDVSSTIVE